MPISRFAWVLALVFVAIAAALPSAAEPMPETSSAGNPADKAFVRAMQDMMSAMHRDEPTGNADADFVHMMLPHHQGAVDMAKVELQYGKDASLKDMAKEIVAAQEKEIALMKAWEDKQTLSH